MIETKDKAFFTPEELSQIEELKSKLQELATVYVPKIWNGCTHCSALPLMKNA